MREDEFELRQQYCYCYRHLAYMENNNLPFSIRTIEDKIATCDLDARETHYIEELKPELNTKKSLTMKKSCPVTVVRRKKSSACGKQYKQESGLLKHIVKDHGLYS